MPRTPVLEVFGPPDVAACKAAPSSELLNELRMEVFGEGFAAGRAAAAEEARVSAADLELSLGERLQELSFTYHEARGHVLRALAPLLNEICTVVLPCVARTTLAANVAEILADLASDIVEPPLTLVLHPESRAKVETFVAAAPASPPIRFSEDATLGLAEVHLRFDDQDRRIDLEAICEDINRMATNFIETYKEAPDDGNVRA